MVLVSSSIPVDVGDSYIRIMVGEEDALDNGWRHSANTWSN